MKISDVADTQVTEHLTPLPCVQYGRWMCCHHQWSEGELCTVNACSLKYFKNIDFRKKLKEGGDLFLEDAEEPVSPGFSPDKREMKSWESHMHIQD